jgi:hypothetical protein
MEEYQSDFEDFAKLRPDVIRRWKHARPMNQDGSWDTPEDAFIQEEIRVAAYDHYRSRHPESTVSEMSKAYGAYAAWVRRGSFE